MNCGHMIDIRMFICAVLLDTRRKSHFSPYLVFLPNVQLWEFFMFYLMLPNIIDAKIPSSKIG